MIFLLPAALLLGIGALIKYKKITWLISGYNTASEEKKLEYDIDKLCNHVGDFLFREAVIFLGMAFYSVMFEKHIAIVVAIGFAIILVFTIGGLVYLNTGDRVKK